MEKKTFEIVSELIKVCESYNYCYSLENNKDGDYRLLVHCSQSVDSSLRLMAGAFLYDILEKAHKYGNISSCFNADSASLNFSIWKLPFNEVPKVNTK